MSGVRGQTIEERFFSKVDKAGPVAAHRPDLGACWLWTASTQSSRYPQFRLGDVMVLAHRLAHEMFIGPIGPGLDVDHKCGFRRCVNPAHLEAITRRENLRRAFERVPVGA